MPKIRATTVAEHRRTQKRALVEAARSLLQESGKRPTLAEVGAKAGLARSSVYQYFDTADDLLLAVVDAQLPVWNEAIRTAVDAESNPGHRVLAYAWANLRLAAQGEHEIAKHLGQIQTKEVAAQKVRAVHAALRQPLITALEKCGIEDVPVAAAVIGGAINAALKQLEAGATFDSAWNALARLLSVFEEYEA